jgi:hypothetical protein
MSQVLQAVIRTLPDLNWLNQQNTWRKICRLVLPDPLPHHQSWALVYLKDWSANSPSGAGRAYTFSRRITRRRLVLRNKCAYQAICSEELLEPVSRSKATPYCGPEQNLSLKPQWTSQRMCISPSPPWSLERLPPLQVKPALDLTCDHLWTGTQQAKFTGTQQPTEVTRNGSQCGSESKSKLHSQPGQRLENIWTKPSAWCIATRCKF